MNLRVGIAGLTLLVLAGCGPGVSLPATPAGPAADAPPAAGVAVGDDWVQPLIGGPAAFAAVAAALDGAARRVEVEMYEFQRADLAERLMAAHARGAAVVVITDALAAGSEGISQRLRAAGITTVDYPAERRSIDHVKLLLVDGARAIVGGINWGLLSDRHRDYAVEVRGPVVTNLERVFQSDLAAAGRPADRPAGVADQGVRVLTTRPGRGIEAAVLAALSGARNRVTVEMFVLTAPQAIEALLAAHRRGVSVRVLLDAHQDETDARGTLIQAGIPAAHYRGPGKLHAKAVVIDGQRVLFGSANWTNSGFGANHELDLEIVSPGVAAVFEAAMARGWPGNRVRAGGLPPQQVLPRHQTRDRDPHQVQERRRDVA